MKGDARTPFAHQLLSTARQYFALVSHRDMIIIRNNSTTAGSTCLASISCCESVEPPPLPLRVSHPQLCVRPLPMMGLPD